MSDYQVTKYSDNFKDYFKYNNRRGDFQWWWLPIPKWAAFKL